jgi:hypothetical protein
MGEEKYRVSMGILEQKRPLGRPRHRWKDNITVNLKELGWEGINLAEDRDKWQAIVSGVMNLIVPYTRGPQIFQKSRSNLHILGSRRVT